MRAIRSVAVNTLVVVASIAVFFLALEIFIRVSDFRMATPAPRQVPAVVADRFAGVPPDLIARDERRKAFLTMPEEWQRRPVEVAGSALSYYWHGVLHVHNDDQMRHLGPFPPRQPGVIRIAVFGDSNTYGYAVAEEDTLSHRLGQFLSHDGGSVEALNLGVSGARSEDIARLMESFIPKLKPDVVVYAVTLNAFLPSFMSEYHFSYALPLPEGLKRFTLAHSRALAFTSDLYDAALRRAHLRRDSFDDVLADFGSYQERFGRDVERMQEIATAAGLGRIVGIVIDTFPEYGGRGQAIAQIAERAMTAAGFDVVASDDFYRRYNGDRLLVSRWEGHPNEIAHYIWAQMIARRLQTRVADIRQH